MRRHDALRALSLRQVIAQGDLTGRAVVGFRDAQQDRGPGVVVPDLGTVDMMPMTAFAGLQQEVDTGCLLYTSPSPRD